MKEREYTNEQYQEVVKSHQDRRERKRYRRVDRKGRGASYFFAEEATEEEKEKDWGLEVLEFEEEDEKKEDDAKEEDEVRDDEEGLSSGRFACDEVLAEGVEKEGWGLVEVKKEATPGWVWPTREGERSA